VKVLIISDSFLPEGNAAAVHMSELQKYYDDSGVETIIATSALGDLDLGNENLIKIIRFPNKWKRSDKLVLRAIGELFSAIVIGIMIRFYYKPKNIERVIVYSPSIFWALTLKILKINEQKVRLIVRDIFPLWLLNAGILKKSSPAFIVLNVIAKLQFKMAGRVFLQAEQDIEAIKYEYHVDISKLFLLQTWMNKDAFKPVSELDKLISKANRNLLWLGNMGVAQNRDFIISMLKNLVAKEKDVSINLVGLKDHDCKHLEEALSALNDDQRRRIEIIKYLTHDYCVQLAIRSDLGIFSLGGHTTSGNVPGKFITYIMAGLPVFGVCDKDTKISSIVMNNHLGYCYNGKCSAAAAADLLRTLNTYYEKEALDNYFMTYHSTENAAKLLLE